MVCSPSLSFNLPFLLHTGYVVLVNNPAFLISAPVFLPRSAFVRAFCHHFVIGNMSIGNQYEQHDNLSSREVPAQQAMITCEIHRHCSYDASQLYVLKKDNRCSPCTFLATADRTLQKIYDVRKGKCWKSRSGVAVPLLNFWTKFLDHYFCGFCDKKGCRHSL